MKSQIKSGPANRINFGLVFTFVFSRSKRSCRFFSVLATALLLASCASQPKSVASDDESQSASTGRSDTPAAPIAQAIAPAAAAGGAPPVSPLAKEVAAEENAPYVVEISFKKGSSQLTAAAKGKLSQLLKSVDNTSQVKAIKVVTWADQDYPSKQAKKLDDLQIKIAKNRNDEIRRYFHASDKSLTLDLHSMAERPGALKDMLGTSDSRIKKSLEVAGIPTTNLAQKMPSKASKSIVMLVLKEPSK